MQIMKSGKKNTWKKWNNQIKKKLRTLGEKKPYKCFGILKADTMKQDKMKDYSFKKSQENEKAT